MTTKCLIPLDRICTEFETMKEKALCEPKDTREMIDLMKYVEQAQQKTLIKLKEDIKVCSYLIDKLLTSFDELYKICLKIMPSALFDIGPC